MTIWYVTTGRSLSERSRCWKPIDDEDLLAEIAVLDGRSDGDIRSQVDCGYDLLRRYALVRAGVLAALGEDRAAKMRKAQGLVAGRFRAECWNGTRLRALSAELATLFFLRSQVEAGDEVVLLGSESNENDVYLDWAALERLRDEGRSAAPSVTITARPEYSLDPKSTGIFNEGVRRLWAEMKDQVSNACLVLTGGYKAVLIALALRVGGSEIAPRICYLHEDESDGLIWMDKLPDRNGDQPSWACTGQWAPYAE